MSDAPRRHLSLVALSLVGCTTLIGLPDLPEVGSGGAAGSGGAVGSGGAPGAGGSRGGNAGSSVAGSSAKGGSSSGGDSSLGGSNAGGPSRGGSSVGGAEMGGSSTGGGTDGGAGNGPDTGGTGDVGAGGTTGGSGGSGGSDTACTPACDSSMNCVSGECVCPTGQTDCSGQCFDLEIDVDHCGNCTHTCDDGCSAGRCYTRVGTIPHDVIALAVNGTHVYYAARDTGILGRFPRDGGNDEGIAQDQDEPVALALDATNVYWANMGNSAVLGMGSVMKRALSGGLPVALATDELSPVFVAVDADHVYWANYPPQPPTYLKAPIAVGSKSDVASGTALTNAVDFSLDGGYVYWAGWYDTGAVWRVAVSDPNQIQNLTSIEEYASTARVFGDSVYFLAGGSTPTVRKVSKTGGDDTEVTQASAGHMFVDSSGIYLASGRLPDGTKNAIVKVSLDGSSVSVLALTASGTYAFAVSDSDVYWVDEDYFIKKTSKTP